MPAFTPAVRFDLDAVWLSGCGTCVCVVNVDSIDIDVVEEIAVELEAGSEAEVEANPALKVADSVTAKG